LRDSANLRMLAAMAAFLGRLAGSMLNPAVWGIVLAVVLIMRNRTAWTRLAVALGLVLVSAVLLYALVDDLTVDEKVRGTLFGLLSAVVWFAIFTGVSGWWRRR
jgi:Na+-transporting NADH:ubiquinone oxidoreductase subunit NqrB